MRGRKGHLNQEMIDCLKSYDKDGKTLEKYHYDISKVNFFSVLDDIVKNTIQREEEFMRSLVESGYFSSVRKDDNKDIVAKLKGDSGVVIHFWKTFWGMENPTITLKDEDYKLVNDSMSEVERLLEKHKIY
ncbi:hypothetical protein IJJ97_01840 [bacterium]|nr:hypothetical protein [bacterium]